MAEHIKDGTGTSNLLRINADNRAEVDAVVQTEETVHAEKGHAFTISTLALTLNSTNPHLLLYIKNTNPNLNLYTWVANFSWNGGSTNYNRTMKWGWLVSPNEPTANHTSITPGNLNFNSANIAEATAYKWDGVGDGMTYTGGGIGAEYNFGQGFSTLETRGIPILGLNHAFGLIITGEEVGDVALALRFYYK